MLERSKEQKLKSRISLAIILTPWFFIILYLILGCFCLSFVGLSSCATSTVLCKTIAILVLVCVIVSYCPFLLLALMEKLHIQVSNIANIFIVIIIAVLNIIWIYYLTRFIYFLINKFKK